MLFYLAVGVCKNPYILRIIYFIKILLKVLKYMLPMFLILMVSIDIVKIITSMNADSDNKNIKMSIKRIIFCMAVFLVVPITNLVVHMSADALDDNSIVNKFNKCYDNATLSKIKNFQEAYDAQKKEEDFSDVESKDITGGAKITIVDGDKDSSDSDDKSSSDSDTSSSDCPVNITKSVNNNKISNASKTFSDDLKNALYKKNTKKMFMTINKDTIDGTEVYITHIIVKNPSSQINGEPANGSYGSGLETTSSAAKRVGAVLAINGSHFINDGTQDLDNHGSYNANDIAIVNGKIVSGGKAGGMEICLSKNGSLFTCPKGVTANKLLSDCQVKYTFSSHDSHLIEDGKHITSEDNGHSYNKTVIGMTEPGEYYIVTGVVTNSAVADYLLNTKKCTYAKSMDQGGSVSLVYNNKLINNPTDGSERSVGDILYFK